MRIDKVQSESGRKVDDFRAYVLVSTRMGEMGHVANAARLLKAVADVDVTIGEWDVLLSVHAKDHDSLERTVAEIRHIPGVYFAVGCLVVPSTAAAVRTKPPARGPLFP